MKSSIVIPTYNGRELLKRNLPSVVAAAKTVEAEVVVVDDGGTDDTAGLVAGAFPSVRLLTMPRNAGFGAAVNAGMAAARGEVAFCLNNDVHVPPDALPPLLRHFDDPACFAVSPRMPRESLDEALVRGRFHRGWLQTFRYAAPPAGMTGAVPILYACGGAAVYRLARFHELGGFDPLFRPFNGEDVDISYRAMKRGWRVLWEPASVVHHTPRSTIGRFYPTPYIRQTQVRARLLVAWRDITDRGWTAAHVLWLLPRVAARAARGEGYFVRAVASCLRDLPAIVRGRRRERAKARVSDRDVLAAVAPFSR